MTGNHFFGFLRFLQFLFWITNIIIFLHARITFSFFRIHPICQANIHQRLSMFYLAFSLLYLLSFYAFIRILFLFFIIIKVFHLLFLLHLFFLIFIYPNLSFFEYIFMTPLISFKTLTLFPIFTQLYSTITPAAFLSLSSSLLQTIDLIFV